MNLTGNLKDKVARAETMEEKKNIIADAGMELTDEELEGVAGGVMDSNLYLSAIAEIRSSHQTVETKVQALFELEKMNICSEKYGGYDITKMLSKYGIK